MQIVVEVPQPWHEHNGVDAKIAGTLSKMIGRTNSGLVVITGDIEPPQ